MDCIFNVLIIPKSSPSKIIIPPIKKTFINGLSSKYSQEYPEQLSTYIDSKTYLECISQINMILNNYWPCTMAFLLSYLCSPCSLGLSFFLPKSCFDEAENLLTTVVNQINSQFFNPSKIHLKFIKKCSTSWFEITFLDKSLIYDDSL